MENPQSESQGADDEACFAQAVVAMARLDRHGRCVRVNQRFASLLGHAAETLRGRPFDTLFAPADDSAGRERFHRLADGALDEAVDQRSWQRPDGTRGHAQVSMGPVRGPGGRVDVVLAVVVDVTRRGEEEAALRAQTKRFQSILENTTQGVVLEDARGTIVFANAAAERVLGIPVHHPAGEAARDPSWRIVRTDGSAYPREEQPGMMALRTGLPVTKSVMGIVTPHHDAPIWISADAIPLCLGAETAPSAVVVTFDDITDRIRAEEAARETNERFELAFHSSPLSVVISRPGDGVYVDVNQAALATFGYTRDEVVGRSVMTMNLWTNPRDRDEIVAKLMSEGQVNRRELLLRHKAGHEIRCLVSLRLISIRGVKHLLFVSEDVTQLRALEAQVIQSQKLEAVGRLAGGVAHDFNNLLTVILGSVEEILETIPPTSDARPAALEIKESAERASTLTRQLLAVSRKHVVQPEVLDLNEVVTGVTRLLRRLIGEDLELLVRPGVGVGAVKMDRGQLEQVLLNLAVNARDAMPRGGRLSIETARDDAAAVSGTTHDRGAGPGVFLRVIDTGTGMSPEVKSHLFEPFFTTKTPDKGTGLGLSTVYDIVKRAGGSIAVHSEPGCGSTFEVRLPVVSGDGPPGHPDAEGPRPGGAETVLVVEDEPSVRGLCVRALRAAGYTVLEATNGAEALGLARAADGRRITLVLSDVVMPGINGVELTKQLRALRPGLHVILMSGYTDVAIELPPEDPGISFLQKPFGADVLARAVRLQLDRGAEDQAPTEGRTRGDPAA